MSAINYVRICLPPMPAIIEEFKENRILIALSVLLVFWAVWPLFNPGFFPSMDGHIHLYHAFQLHEVLASGHIPPRWCADCFVGYGQPVFSFYSPLFFYLVALLMSPLVGLLAAAKTVLILAYLASFSGMFLLGREFWGFKGGLISALSYTLIPYQFINLYVRGAYPEFLIFSLLPFSFWSLYKLSQETRSIFFLISSLSLALLFLAHNFLAVVSLPFILVFIILLSLQTKRPILFLPLAFGLSLSAFFWLPALLEKKYLLAEVEKLNYDFHDSFAYLNQLISSPWGYGANVKGPGDGMSFQVGFPHLVLFLFSIFVFPKLDALKKIIYIFGIFSFLAATFMTLPYSLLIWDNLPFLDYAQFPWRFLVLVVFFVSFISGSIVLIFPKNNLLHKLLVFLVLAIIGFLNLPYAHPKDWHLQDIDSYYKESILGYPRAPVLGDDFTPRWALEKPKTMTEGKVLPRIEEDPFFENGRFRFSTTFPEPTKITINNFYFPGWRVYLDNKENPIEISRTGLIMTQIPRGKHDIQLVFEETFARKISDLLSLFSLIILIIIASQKRFLEKLNNLLNCLLQVIKIPRF
ncbi:MAG: hypothetical protein Q7S03_02475 [bacterium]|nr:hypothetical protein [bacterium]